RARRGRAELLRAEDEAHDAAVGEAEEEAEEEEREALGGPHGLLRLLDVAGDLRHELLLARERALVAQPAPELDDEAPAVEVADEVEQERVDPALVAAVVRVHADRDRRAAAEGRARVDAERRHEQLRGRSEVRRREAQRPAARIAGDHGPLELRRP